MLTYSTGIGRNDTITTPEALLSVVVNGHENSVASEMRFILPHMSDNLVFTRCPALNSLLGTLMSGRRLLTSRSEFCYLIILDEFRDTFWLCRIKVNTNLF